MNFEISLREEKRYVEEGIISLPGLLSSPELKSLKLDVHRIRHDPVVLENGQFRYVLGLCGTRIADRIQPILGDLNVPSKNAVFRSIEHILRILNWSKYQLFSSKLIFANPGSPGAPLHTDISWWRGISDPSSVVTMALHLDDSTLENGAVVFYPGSHHLEFRHPNLPELSVNSLPQSVLQNARPLLAGAGSVSVFASNIVHWSPPNISGSSRQILYITIQRHP